MERYGGGYREVWKWSWRGMEVVIERYGGGHGEVWRWS